MFCLRPSDIRFSQDSINNYFDAKCNHSHKTIGETLDDICTNRPSDIRFSQDSINNYFDAKCNHSLKTIGETLDDICTNRIDVDDIPTIQVVLRNGHWTTADNRRLWVFRELERLGYCDEIPVRQGHYIPAAKLTSTNEGTSVRVRGSPGGFWHRKPFKAAMTPKQTSTPSYGYYFASGHAANHYTDDPYQITAQRHYQGTSAQSRIIGTTPTQTYNNPSRITSGGRNDHVTYPGSRSSSYGVHQGDFSSSRTYRSHDDERRPRDTNEVHPSFDYHLKKDTGWCVII